MNVALGYHRYFTHRSFRASRPLVIALECRTLGAQGKLKHWVATHRLHHRYADSIYDPHSPLKLMNMEMELQQSPEVIFSGLIGSGKS